MCRTLIAGTSQATPHVAGAIALLLGTPNGSTLTPVTAKEAICSTADPVLGTPLPGNQYPAGRPTGSGTAIGSPTGVAGCGELNVYRAMTAQLFGLDPGTVGDLTL